MPAAPTSLATLAALATPLPRPAALVDLDAVDHNLDALAAALAPGPTLRLATKSIRHRGLIRYALDRLGPRAGGLMCHHPAEAAWLAAEGFDDLLVAYPTVDAAALAAMAEAVAAGATIRIVVDDPAHLAALGHAAESAGCVLDALIDVDVSYRPLGDRGPHPGARRSPIRTAAAALTLARAARGVDRVRVTGVMAYEAHVAGTPDTLATRAFKRLARPAVRRSRAVVIDALRDAGEAIELANGGGTGSVGWSSRDPALTEVAAGSGVLCSHLFDRYDGLALRPALFVALEICRRPDRAHLTCAKGGVVASGAPGPDRLPRPVWPPGLAYLDLEGAGEVQTPFRCPPDTRAALGDTVLVRPAKAGEPAERFERYHLVRGGILCGTEPTYRGEGRAFG